VRLKIGVYVLGAIICLNGIKKASYYVRFFLTCAFVFNYLLFFILVISLYDFIEDDIFTAVAMNFIVLWDLTTQKTF